MLSMSFTRILTVFVLLTSAPLARPSTETILHNFEAPPMGRAPFSNLYRDSAGNLYGTTGGGGAANVGIIFKLDASGHETVLYSFTGGADGAYPNAGVIADSAGNLYGTTTGGGAANSGVVYKLDPANQETVLYTFTGGADGSHPYSGVVRDPQGNLYGTTVNGGTAFGGVVYKVDATGQQTVLHTFTGPDGVEPYGGVIRDDAGNLYGTTFYGGTMAGNAGLVFRLETSGRFNVIYNFTGGPDGGLPYASLTGDSAGNLYGTATSGGTAGSGVVFKLDKTGKESVLHSFTGGADGSQSYASLLLGPAGNLYGTTYSGGTANAGVVFGVSPSGQEKVLYTFTGSADGAIPNGGVVADSMGNLYGTTTYGGNASLISGYGTVYKLSPSGLETVLLRFPAALLGISPATSVTANLSCNDALYGATLSGGTANAGVVYEVHRSGQETVLYSFSGGADGSGPDSGLVLDSSCNVYGTTYSGGSGFGVVYKIDTAGHETVLYSFTGGADGANPTGVVRDPSGNFFGTTTGGGTGNAGVVFRVAPSGHETVLHNFTGGPDGGRPLSGVTLDAAGNLYGTASSGGTNQAGVVYQINKAGQQTVLYNFTGGADGGYPSAGVIRGADGTLYGTAESGVSFGGVVYKLDTSSTETVLHSFTGGADGGYPTSGLILDSSGNLYGTTPYGGIGQGVVYEVTPAGQETVLFTFTGGPDGANPEAALIRDMAGNLYGTTYNGGDANAGVVFRINSGPSPHARP